MWMVMWWWSWLTQPQALTWWFCWCPEHSAVGLLCRGSGGCREQTQWPRRWLTYGWSPLGGQSWKNRDWERSQRWRHLHCTSCIWSWMKRGDDISVMQSSLREKRQTSRHLRYSQGNNQPFPPKTCPCSGEGKHRAVGTTKCLEHSRGHSSTQHSLEKQLRGHLLGDTADAKASAILVGRILTILPLPRAAQAQHTWPGGIWGAPGCWGGCGRAGRWPSTLHALSPSSPGGLWRNHQCLGAASTSSYLKWYFLTLNFTT